MAETAQRTKAQKEIEIHYFIVFLNLICTNPDRNNHRKTALTSFQYEICKRFRPIQHIVPILLIYHFQLPILLVPPIIFPLDQPFHHAGRMILQNHTVHPTYSRHSFAILIDYQQIKSTYLWHVPAI